MTERVQRTIPDPQLTSESAGTVLMCWYCGATFEPTDPEWVYVVDEGCPDCGSWDIAVETVQPRRPR
jgi:hypothetical protein